MLYVCLISKAYNLLPSILERLKANLEEIIDGATADQSKMEILHNV
jgi:hypothetical protein